jgi:hypothetical protein
MYAKAPSGDMAMAVGKSPTETVAMSSGAAAAVICQAMIRESATTGDNRRCGRRCLLASILKIAVGLNGLKKQRIGVISALFNDWMTKVKTGYPASGEGGAEQAL